jgi:hypothetical protein
MFRQISRAILAGVLLVVAMLGGTGIAQAEKPRIERVDVNDTFVDRFLSRECGVRVTGTATGRVTFKEFDREGTGPLFAVNINVLLTLTAGDNTVRIRDVGSDMERRQPDGTVLLRISGQVPFGFKGTLKINLTTGEVVHEPQRTQDTGAICAALTR